MLTESESYDVARGYARKTLHCENPILDGMGILRTPNLAEKVVVAGNGTYLSHSKYIRASEWISAKDTMISLANSENSNGCDIFSGYQTDNQSFWAQGYYRRGYQAISQWRGECTEMQVGDVGSDILISTQNADLVTHLNGPFRY